MKAIYLDSAALPYPGYPHAVAGGGFVFLSGLMPLDGEGEVLSGRDQLPGEGASMDTEHPTVNAVEGPVGAHSWAGYHQMKSIMAKVGGTLDDVMREHIYQKNKRFFPVFEKVRMIYEPETPAPSSGIGVCETSPDGKSWIVLDAIGLDRTAWKGEGRKSLQRSAGAIASASHYSQAVEASPFIFTAGHIPLDTTKPGNPVIRTFEDVPEEGRFLQAGRSHTDARNGPIAAQTWFIYKCLKDLLEGAGSGLNDVVNATAYLQDMNDYHTFHEVHARFFPDTHPAMTVTQFDEVGHRGTFIEIELTALRQTDGFGRKFIRGAGALRPGAHCSLAAIAGPLIYISGQAGCDARGRAIEKPSDLPKEVRSTAAALVRATGRPAPACQAVAIFENLAAILKEAGASFSSLGRMILYLDDFADFIAFDAVCKHYIPAERPALACVQIPRAHPVPGARMCVEAIAVKE